MIEIPRPVGLKNAYDVVVIGAGPAGSRCAKLIADRGLSVAVFEKRAEIGSPKRCAEGIGVKALQRMGYNGNERFVAQYIDGFYLYAPNGKEFVMDYGSPQGCVVERKVFDKFLAYDAAKAGAKVFTKIEVVDLLKDNGAISGVVIKYGEDVFEVKARVVVSAEGIEGKMARKAGIDNTNKLINVDSGYQYEMANLKLKDANKLYFYLGNEIAPRGYIWIFPKGDHVANVGIGIGGGAGVKRKAKEYLDSWIENHPEIFADASVIEENAGGIPVGGLLKDMVRDGFVVIGDAAHTVNPIHGGGMDEGTRAGEIAAEVICECLNREDVSHDALAKFNELWWKERGEKLRRIEKLRQVIERMSDDDLNFLADELTVQDIIDFAGGKNLRKLAKILLRRPKLIKLATILR